MAGHKLSSHHRKWAIWMLTIPSDPPWLGVPAQLSAALRPSLPDVVAEVIAAVAVAVPDYARPLEGRFGEGVRQGVEVALGRFLELPGTREPALPAESRRVYAALGRGEVRQGRTLEGLLAAYRAGARVTLRRMSEGAIEAGLDTDALVALGESVLAYIEELSAASAEGFAFEQSERAGEMDRRRAELLELLLHGQADDLAAQTAAAAAGWVLPQTLVAVTMPLEEASGVRFRLGSRALTMARPTDVVALVPAPRAARDRGELERVLTGRRAVVGPARDWRRVPDSLRLATMAATTLDGSLPRPGPEPFWVEDHLAELVLGAESQALEDLARSRLAPFATLRPAQREKLATTLLSWLQHWGQRGLVAEELHIHPQTVGYRLTQLRELFGDELEDPQARFELELVLRAGHR
ncbi:MAG: helix-turn-helix domain-containing protein [Actinomycetota bacterium]|nr:helix-turn-helix domain-containing protein [Actinomycetota bacterium]